MDLSFKAVLFDTAKVTSVLMVILWVGVLISSLAR